MKKLVLCAITCLLTINFFIQTTPPPITDQQIIKELYTAFSQTYTLQDFNREVAAIVQHYGISPEKFVDLVKNHPMEEFASGITLYQYARDNSGKRYFVNNIDFLSIFFQ